MTRAGSVLQRLALALTALATATCAPRPPEAPPPMPPPVGERAPSWDVYAFDVGTGLSMLVRGGEFALLYDGGSNDDRATGDRDRLLAYLDGTLGRSGGPECHPGDSRTYPLRPLAHVVLSHPHRDHVQFLADVLRCYAVANAWDSGADGDAHAYEAFLEAVAASGGTVYHVARALDGEGHVGRHGTAIPASRRRRFGEGDAIPLGRAARATVLRVKSDVRDLNDASIVLRFDLGRASVLFTGDVTGGERADPDEPPQPGSGEADLLARHRRELDVDVLQVGHHGSRTSSRARFLDAVTPAWAIVSSGPTRYGPVTLPDAEIVDELARRGARVLRTDVDDAACGARHDKVGTDDDGEPGGCNAVHLRIDERGRIVALPGP